jgi:hypothetical protein
MLYARLKRMGLDLKTLMDKAEKSNGAQP